MSHERSPGEDLAKQLDESLHFIRQQEALMRKCLESKGKLLDAIKHASTLLAELRTSALSPKQYYELYIAVFDALAYLGSYLKEGHPTHHLADIYELVQYAGNIVPRLYLMITVGTVYMSIPEAPVKEIMRDMMEMCRGVQHPIRGLFLRYYLSQRCKDYLPIGSSDGPEGNLQDSIQFTITNFIEMNKLWVRLQHQGHSRERDKRTRERQELQILVGSNLVRLSQLEGIGKQYYRQTILPAILEQVVQCRDVLAQEYLLDVIVQVFPDEFHLYTLDLFLDATTKLNPNVSIKKIMLTLVGRLADYAERESGSSALVDALKEATLAESRDREALEQDEATIGSTIHGASDLLRDRTQQAEHAEQGEQDEEQSEADAEEEAPVEEQTTEEADDKEAKEASPEDKDVPTPAPMNLFAVFWKHVDEMIKARPDIPLQDVIAIAGGITKLSLSCYPDDKENLDQILEFATTKCKEASSGEMLSREAIAAVQDLLLTLVDFYSDSLLTVLSIPHYLPLLNAQPVSTQKAIASSVLDNILTGDAKIASVDDANGLFGLVAIVIKEGSGAASEGGSGVPGGVSTARDESPTDSDAVVADQSRLAKLVHMLFNEDCDIQARLLSTARKALSDGGARIKYTYPALVTNALKLVRRYSKLSADDKTEKIGSTFKFIQRVLDELYQSGAVDQSHRLYVSCAKVADQVGAEEASYEFFAQAFTIYEEAISDSRNQYQAICIIAGALQSTRNFTAENYDTLVSKCALHASKLLKKPDQCRAVYLCSHLWWAVEIPARGEEEDDSGNSPLFRDDKRVLECLQRALRVADACMDVAVSVELFVEILNRYVYYYDRGSTAVTVKYINGLIDLIKTNLENNAEGGISDSPRKHFERTLEFIRTQDDEKFRQIVT
ncbi:vacuolar protein sorting-associated protein 35 [Trichomonascus vanleenenianus]|uniref:retromer subunit VPS35 n=1 Tax=Trichomonascus vanleenenianus TaxID=2268995 RepID=UPI003ECB2CD5